MYQCHCRQSNSESMNGARNQKLTNKSLLSLPVGSIEPNVMVSNFDVLFVMVWTLVCASRFIFEMFFPSSVFSLHCDRLVPHFVLPPVSSTWD